MARVTRYEVVKPHYCPTCDRMVAQTTETRAWVVRLFAECPACDRIVTEILLDAYRQNLNVIYLEGSNT